MTPTTSESPRHLSREPPLQAAEGVPVPAVRLRHVSKAYGRVRANRGIDLEVPVGSIHGLLGENGAGKSTLMKILFGLVQPDEGIIEVDGQAAGFRSPGDAIAAGIGMVQQHFSLIADFTVVENLILGDEPVRGGWRLDRDGAARQITELSERYGFRIDPRRRVGEMAVGARQRVEILKALYRGADILILDEPTAALAPQECGELFGVLRELRQQGRTVIFISHKLPEIIELCDRVTVLRDGAVVGGREITEAERAPGPGRAALEGELARLMVGRDLPTVPERGGHPGSPILAVMGITDGRGLGPLDFAVHGGEILGIAGVEGNGQSELVELLLGIRKCAEGTILLSNHDISRLSVERRFRSGIAHIAEDRHAAAMAMRMSVADNATLGFQNQRPFARGRHWLSTRWMRLFAEAIVRRFDIRTTSVTAPARSLSGGNQQKLVVGRELARRPLLMIASQPTRGLDVGATAFVHQELAALRSAGKCVLLVSLDLSEIMALADRIVVLYKGQIAGEARAGEVDAETLGTWMTGGQAETQHPKMDGLVDQE